MAQLPRYDAAMQQRLAAARGARQGAALRRQDHRRRARPPSGLRSSMRKHAFANIALTDNVVRFATRRYCDNPLIVQGPGAGPEVTAGRGVRGPAAPGGLSRGAPVSRAGAARRARRPSRRPRSATSRSASTSSDSPSAPSGTASPSRAAPSPGVEITRGARRRRRAAARAAATTPPAGRCWRCRRPCSRASASRSRSTRAFRWARAWAARRPRRSAAVVPANALLPRAAAASSSC